MSGATGPLEANGYDPLPRTTKGVRARNRVAFLVDCALNGLRTQAVIDARWWRPFWQAGYDAGLKRAHDEAVAVLVEAGCQWPTAPRATGSQHAPDGGAA